MKQQKAEQDREEAEMKIAEVKWSFSFNYSDFRIVQLYNSFHLYAFHCIIILKLTYFLFLLQLKEDIQVRSNEAQREARKKEKTEKELKQAKNDLETRTAELKTKAGNLQRAQEDIAKLEQQLKEQRVGL